VTTIQKGDWIRAQWLTVRDIHGHPFSLAGVQDKRLATVGNVSGIVRHVRGDHPTAPTSVRLYIDPDEGQGTVTPPGCSCGPHVEVDPVHVVDWRRA
jgi:hypothetical protein